MAAPSAFQFYANNIDIMNDATLAGSTINLLLTTSTYTPDTTNTGHTVLANVTNELANGNGYATGGVSVGVITLPTFSTTGFKLVSASNASWTATGTGIPAWRYGVLYVVGTLWGVTSPLLAVFTGDSAPADVPLTAAGNSLVVTIPTNGWFTVTRV